ncbi:hypothetical protein [uncultured Desulfovibrio sp.]|uniref:hypothetical protein n=1 Tax=uncultured Desulfovibrio sp. TaxID=167968 RepID=UPI00262F1768|nr:hypothetical protein [uncultured Desulfovibrio sp.]
MTRWSIIALSVLACASLAVNAALWRERRGLMEEARELRASVTALSAARAADDSARDARDKIKEAARHDAAQKHKALDRIEMDGAGLDDSAYLDALRRLLHGDADRGPDAAGKPAGGLPASGDAGGAHARQ